MELLLTGTLAENTFQSKLKASPHFSEFYGGKHNPAGLLPKILLYILLCCPGFIRCPARHVFVLASGARHPPATLGTRQTAWLHRRVDIRTVAMAMRWAGFNCHDNVYCCACGGIAVMFERWQVRWKRSEDDWWCILTIRTMSNTFIGNLWLIQITFSGTSS